MRSVFASGLVLAPSFMLANGLLVDISALRNLQSVGPDTKCNCVMLEASTTTKVCDCMVSFENALIHFLFDPGQESPRPALEACMCDKRPGVVLKPCPQFPNSKATYA